MGPHQRGQVRSDPRDQIHLHPAARTRVAPRRRAAAARYTERMRRRVISMVVLALAVLAAARPLAQTKHKAPAKKAAVKPEPLKTSTPDVKCPSLIGMGVKTVRSFCDVPAGRDPALGMVVELPAHTGTATLMFDLHARHTYSEDEMQRGKAYAHYRAGIGVLTMDGDLLGRGAVDAEFRTAADLFDRIG